MAASPSPWAPVKGNVTSSSMAWRENLKWGPAGYTCAAQMICCSVLSLWEGHNPAPPGSSVACSAQVVVKPSSSQLALQMGRKSRVHEEPPAASPSAHGSQTLSVGRPVFWTQSKFQNNQTLRLHSLFLLSTHINFIIHCSFPDSSHPGKGNKCRITISLLSLGPTGN